MRPIIATVTCALLAACASAPNTKIYVAPNERSVLLISEDVQMSPGQLLYVVNESSVPITVTSVRLSSCENVKNRCESHKLAVRIEPGSRRQVMKVEPVNPEFGYSYRSYFGWQAEGTPITIQPPGA